MRWFFCAFALLIPQSLWAQTAMTAEEFDAYATGKTLTYAVTGGVYGVEQYLPGRRVRWAFTEDICQDGYWYPQAGDICFVYENEPEAQCWQFFQTPTGLRAKFTGGPDGTELMELEQTDTPLACPGPDVGV